MTIKKESTLKNIYFSLSPLFFMLYALNVFTRGGNVARTMFYLHICVYSIILYLYFKKLNNLNKFHDEALLIFDPINDLSTFSLTFTQILFLMATVFLSYKYPNASPNASLFHGMYLYQLVDTGFSGIYKKGIFYNNDYYTKDKLLGFTLSDRELKLSVTTSLDYNKTVKIKLSKQSSIEVSDILSNYITR